MQEIDESEQRLSFWLINADTVQMPDGSGPNDLLPMLPHFGRLPTCNRPELWLDEWHCTAESVQTLAPILRGLQGQYEPRIELRREITDEVVSLLLQLGSAAHSVGLPNLRLQSGLVCEAAWPWHVLRIYNHGEEMRITDLLGLPHPGQAEEPPLLCVAGHIVIPALSKVGTACTLTCTRLCHGLMTTCFMSRQHHARTPYLYGQTRRTITPHIVHVVVLSSAYSVLLAA